MIGNEVTTAYHEQINYIIIILVFNTWFINSVNDLIIAGSVITF